MGLSASSVRDVVAHIKAARDITFLSYELHAGSAVEAELITAAHRPGTRVSVTLQADPYLDSDGANKNRASAKMLRAAGARVNLLQRDDLRFHLKAAVCDGVAFLDGVNWTKRGTEVVVRVDDPRDVAAVRGAAAADRSTSALALRKGEALRREVELIRHARHAPVIVETEHIDDSDVAKALRWHARQHAPTTLIVSRYPGPRERELKLLAALRRDGVRVRETGSNQKLALAGKSVWIGSANATRAYPNQVEWGLVTRKARIVAAVADALRRDGAPEPLRPG